ncbi:hypothetical protein V2W30_34660 [Streptomyces sp. Q6]|uniref:Uncharacterized protein n=1 Tax=Streptomyces citrinus TaxID=3118173 RepID=A0ACD5AM46_9ACTN
MTSPIDEVLSRARLRDDDFAYHYLPSALPDTDEPPAPVPLRTGSSEGDLERRARRANAVGARRDLTTLCHTAIILAGADHLTEFLDDTLLPEPESARTLGCYLHLGNAHDGARFWWQFAAGAGDHAAAFCLYLHHLSLEEVDPAAWWQAQTVPNSSPPPHDPQLEFDTAHLPTTLRVLRQLKLQRSLRTPPPPPLRQNTIDYITRAVSFVDDDLELPLPDDTFTAHIRALNLHDPAHAWPDPEPAATARPRLPRRRPGASALALRTAARRATPPPLQDTSTPHGPAREHPHPGADLLHACR